MVRDPRDRPLETGRASAWVSWGPALLPELPRWLPWGGRGLVTRAARPRPGRSRPGCGVMALEDAPGLSVLDSGRLGWRQLPARHGFTDGL